MMGLIREPSKKEAEAQLEKMTQFAGLNVLGGAVFHNINALKIIPRV